MNAWRSVWGPTRLAMPARRAMRRTIRPAAAVDPPPVGSDEDRPVAAFAHREVDGPGGAGRQRDGHHLASFAQDRQRAVPPLQPQVLDVGADGFGHSQPVEREQADQGVIPGAAQPGGDQHGADLVAVQAGGVGLVVQAGTPDVRRRRDADQTFLFGVAVEARHRAQPARDGGPGPAEGLEVAGKAFDVNTARPEHRQPVFGAPGHVLAQIQGVGVAGQAAVASQEPGQRQLLGGAEQLVSPREHSAC